ncbi:acyl carrier protein [Ferruginibacter sp.]|uniref:acyl carrier protein n=1 Tax=Ferruginibacter sp. TaxID=1940288 RepID=UPI0019C6DCE9|nr:acyl carrier protein [Ferruginibacter sp.]MBC7629000.1 acyl carrier protein [Ferruginibacter sp.]
MTYEQVMNEVQEIFRDINDNPTINLKAETTSDDIEEWDSLTHIQLVVAIESYFKITFTADEIVSYNNVGEMCEGIVKKLN